MTATEQDIQRVALVTGASRGIGAACAAALHHDGYRVAVHYRRDERLASSLCDELTGAVAFKADLAQENASEELVKSVKGELGRIDVLVNNAGTVRDQILPFAKAEDFGELIAVNLRPTFLLSKMAARMMIKNKWGRIINITSVVGHSGNFGQSLYAATKSAVTGFTLSIAQDLAQFNILCNCVAPGLIDSEMTARLSDEIIAAIKERIPLKKIGKPQDVAQAVSFLASSASEYITGTTLHVNGGMFAG